MQGGMRGAARPSGKGRKGKQKSGAVARSVLDVGFERLRRGVQRRGRGRGRGHLIVAELYGVGAALHMLLLPVVLALPPLLDTAVAADEAVPRERAPAR